MDIIALVCDDCGANFEVSEMPKRGSVCFKCHVQGIRLGFTYGKEDFHGPTVRERAQKQINDAKANGLEPAYIGRQWV